MKPSRSPRFQAACWSSSTWRTASGSDGGAAGAATASRRTRQAASRYGFLTATVLPWAGVQARRLDDPDCSDHCDCSRRSVQRAVQPVFYAVRCRFHLVHILRARNPKQFLLEPIYLVLVEAEGAEELCLPLPDGMRF